MPILLLLAASMRYCERVDLDDRMVANVSVSSVPSTHLHSCEHWITDRKRYFSVYLFVLSMPRIFFHSSRFRWHEIRFPAVWEIFRCVWICIAVVFGWYQPTVSYAYKRCTKHARACARRKRKNNNKPNSIENRFTFIYDKRLCLPRYCT